MLPEELIKRIRQIQIYTSRAVDASFAGQYESVFKGRGMQFDEVREYMPGDEIRTIDWNVTARTGRPFIKRFVEEREMTVLFAVDLSASGEFGTVSKLKNELAAEFCAVLAFAAAKNNDKVGLLIFTDQVETYVPPLKGRRQVLRVIREILYAKPQSPRTDLARALEYVNHVLTRRAILFVISDFLTGGYAKPLQVAARRHDVVCLRVEDPREVTVPAAGLFELEDAETGARRIVDLSEALAETMRFQATQRKGQLKQTLARYHADLIEIQAGQAPAEPLMAFFERRAKRR